jgi:hypothetical protein
MASWPDENAGIDAAIDAVARQMTEGASPADLRARVLARIDEGGAAAPWWRSMSIAAPLAAAAVVVIAAVLFRAPSDVRLNPDGTGNEVPLKPDATHSSVQPHSQPDSLVSQNPDATPDEPRPTSSSEASPGEPRSARSEPSRGTALQKPHITGAPARSIPNGTTRSAIAALAPPPIELESIVLGPLAPPRSLALDELEPIAPIAVTPLGEGDQR